MLSSVLLKYPYLVFLLKEVRLSLAKDTLSKRNCRFPLICDA